MRARLTALIMIIGVVVALASILILRAEHPASTAMQPLFSTAPQALTSMRATWASGKSVVLLRGPTGWHVAEPIRAPADPTRVAAFLAALSEPVARHYPVSRVPLPKAGLAPPRLVLHAGRQEAMFGTLNPANGLRYVRRGNIVFMVADTVLPRLAAGVWQFVDPHIVPRNRQVTGIHFPDGQLSRAPALLAAWQHAEATSVGPAIAATSATPQRISLTLAGISQPLVLTLLSRHPTLRLEWRAAGISYRLPTTTASHLFPDRKAPSARTSGG